MHPPSCPYRGNVSFFWALKGVQNKYGLAMKKLEIIFVIYIKTKT